MSDSCLGKRKREKEKIDDIKISRIKTPFTDLIYENIKKNNNIISINELIQKIEGINIFVNLYFKYNNNVYLIINKILYVIDEFEYKDNSFNYSIKTSPVLINLNKKINAYLQKYNNNMINELINFKEEIEKLNNINQKISNRKEYYKKKLGEFSEALNLAKQEKNIITQAHDEIIQNETDRQKYIDDFTKAYIILLEEYNKLSEENHKLSDENHKLLDEYNELSDEYDELSDEHDELLQQYKILEEEHNILIEHNTSIKKEVIELSP